MGLESWEQGRREWIHRCGGTPWVRVLDNNQQMWWWRRSLRRLGYIRWDSERGLGHQGQDHRASQP